MNNDATSSQLAPYMVDLKEGETYKFCRCGQSKKLPFCDSSHEGTGAKPHLYKSERTESVNICGCMESDDYPRCDGSHIILF